MTERDIFTAAREKTDPAARAAFLDEACASDATLRARVERLLGAAAKPDSFLDVPVVASLDTDAGALYDSTPERPTNAAADENSVSPLSFLAPSSRPDSLGRL